MRQILYYGLGMCYIFPCGFEAIPRTLVEG